MLSSPNWLDIYNGRYVLMYKLKYEFLLSFNFTFISKMRLSRNPRADSNSFSVPEAKSPIPNGSTIDVLLLVEWLLPCARGGICGGGNETGVPLLLLMLFPIGLNGVDPKRSSPPNGLLLAETADAAARTRAGSRGAFGGGGATGKLIFNYINLK